MANTEEELKQNLKELIESIVDGDDYTVQTADNAIRALSALKVLKRPASPVPPHFRCPLSGHLMTDPVILATGQTFDRPLIQRWLNDILRLYPESHVVLNRCLLSPNVLLQGMISEWCKDKGIYLPKPVFNVHDEQLTEALRHRLHPLLFKLSLSVSEQKEAAKELRQLAKTMSVRALFGTRQMIQLLLRPLSSEAPLDPELQYDLIAAILNLSILDSNKRLLAENEKLIAFLIDSLKSGAVQTRSIAAAALSSMSSLDSNKQIIGRSGAIKYLVDLLEEGDPLAMIDAGSALFRLCCARENIVRTVREGVVQIILGKLVNHILVDDLVDELVSILALLATHTIAVEALVNHGGVRFLLDILRKTTVERVKENAAVILHLICYHNREKREEIKEEELANRTISNVVQNGSETARRKAKSILDCLRIGKPTSQNNPNPNPNPDPNPNPNP
ncbi:U-box domain-containing protein 9-like [Vigna radiata var. radiata]|uniref:RING-type E3 ubiquitin transferase n=1 Tax=Vigna radiata var. radiata TaxID=3916 RepID=A0A1S3UXM4_VIGRR|nr:U-box domain-containing protein 9-like [Vigna radiata var. radiata]